MPQKKSIGRTIYSYLLMTVGIFLYTSSWTLFVIPREISGGGVTGIAAIVYYATHIPVAYTYFGINLILVIIGILTLGKSFGFKTVYCILCASLFLKILPDIIPWTTDIEDNLINVIIAGIMSGVGISMVFMQGGSSGGTDIIALIIAKHHETSPGKVFLYCDLVIITSILLLPDKGLKDVIYGYIEMVTFSYTLDQVMNGNKQSVQILIFSSRYKEIADMLNNELHRGVTALDSVGWYSQTESKVLIVVARRNQQQEITQAVHKIDDAAFITVSATSGVYGRGFDVVKTIKQRNVGGLLSKTEKKRKSA